MATESHSVYNVGGFNMSPGSTNLDAWLQSVEGKPGIIRYELQPITDLLNS